MAASGGHIQHLCDEATCSICLDYFKDPVTIPECGHSFCLSCLILFWEESEAEASCPQCRDIVQRRDLVSNQQLANMVEIAQNLSLQEGREEGGGKERMYEEGKEGGGGVCEDHQETLKLFCKEDEAPIYVVCDRSKEHKHHEVIPLEEAFKEYKDVRSTLQRYEKRESPEKPVAFPPELRNQLESCDLNHLVELWESCDLNHLGEDTMKKWKDVQSFGNLQRANVTLDPDTAHPRLIVFEDRKSVRLEVEAQDLPDNPKRFNYRPCVLGRGGFTAGRHFWEVNVESGDLWDVGVARKSMERKGCFSLNPEGGIWALGKFGGIYLAFTSPPYSPLSLSWEPRRIRVTLDYEGGCVSFYDADSEAELYTFSGASFLGETLLPFFRLWGNKTHLSISWKGNAQWLKTDKVKLNSGLQREGAMAAAGGHIQRLRDEATCSICLDYFKDPVTIAECGHNFCRSCLIQYWGESEAEASCPQCRKTVQRRSLIPNRQLANMVEIAQNLSLQEGREEGGGKGRMCKEGKGEGGKGRVCEKHREPLKLFCKEDEAPICVVCDKSKEHKPHEVIPLEEAFEEYKREICHHLEILRKEREEFLAYQANLDKESKDLLKLTEMERLKTVEKFRELRQFLEEQEKRLLNHMEEVEKEIAGRRDEQLARLSRKLSSLERIIQEMEEKRQQPATELLQDVRSTLQRYEKRENPEKPMAFPPELRNRALESCDLNHLVEDTMKILKDALLCRKQIQKDVQSFRNLQRANVTLDPDTAHPCLILSKDRKSLRRGDKPQFLPDNPERFNEEPRVLGREGFTAGRHFWKVTVGSGEEWDVGVARKSVRRKGFFPLSPEEGIWAVGKWRGKYWAFTFPNYSPLSLSEEPRRIWVTLDYEGGRVSFSDANSGAELYTFSGASFLGETLLPFFCLWGKKIPLSIS
ncbi:zinc finger protein RFP-like [Zootoca vivipara]|uniref:zinc finger protein RFP-like n=1 Tax=Zootoca vivipara TaxID=8524 RepID=UPI00293BE80D|nr:zinc finger protein RFP-like [Zootoca vivipara]